MDGFEDLKDYEEFYQIDRNGRIWSKCSNKFMCSQIDGGYLRTSLTKDKIRNKKRIHRLLAIQFILNPDNLPEVDHIDRNKLNNDLSNLRWVTHSINMNNQERSIANMTEEQKKERIVNLREYKRVWIEKKHRKMGIQPVNYNLDGKIYEYIRKDNNTTYYKAEYNCFTDGNRNKKQKSSNNRQVVEEWLNKMRTEFPTNEVII